jgi:hypothetical protein
MLYKDSEVMRLALGRAKRDLESQMHRRVVDEVGPAGQVCNMELTNGE